MTELMGTKMSQPVYGNINTDGTWDMDSRNNQNQNQTPQHTGSDSVKIRRSRSAVVCLALLCVLLLTAVIVLCVHIHTNNTEEKHQLLTKITNLTEDINGLLIKNENLTKDRDEQKNQLALLCKDDKCFYYKSSFYYLSTGKKNWAESRQDCLHRRADLIIINDTKEQDFVMNITDKREFWIGVTDTVEEGTWKWVDGSTLTSGFWATNGKTPEPNGKQDENCAVTSLTNHPELIGWIDVTCNGDYQWICEKSIWP